MSGMVVSHNGGSLEHLEAKDRCTINDVWYSDARHDVERVERNLKHNEWIWRQIHYCLPHKDEGECEPKDHEIIPDCSGACPLCKRYIPPDYEDQDKTWVPFPSVCFFVVTVEYDIFVPDDKIRPEQARLAFPLTDEQIGEVAEYAWDWATVKETPDVEDDGYDYRLRKEVVKVQDSGTFGWIQFRRKVLLVRKCERHKNGGACQHPKVMTCQKATSCEDCKDKVATEEGNKKGMQTWRENLEPVRPPSAPSRESGASSQRSASVLGFRDEDFFPDEVPVAVYRKLPARSPSPTAENPHPPYRRVANKMMKEFGPPKE